MGLDLGYIAQNARADLVPVEGGDVALQRETGFGSFVEVFYLVSILYTLAIEVVGTADSLAQDGGCRLFEVFYAEDVGESHGGLICSVNSQ